MDLQLVERAGLKQRLRGTRSELIETYEDDAIWEVMYFGHARDR